MCSRTFEPVNCSSIDIEGARKGSCRTPPGACHWTRRSWQSRGTQRHLTGLGVWTAIAFSCAPALCTAGGTAHPVRAPHAMVVSVQGLASQAGVDTMKAGGNAVDAAVAIGFALAVVHPEAGNLGGGGFMLFRSSGGAVHFLDFRERAPGRATPTLYQDARGRVVPELSTIGFKAIGVPGSVKGLVYA